jgi:hypothetical protein
MARKKTALRQTVNVVSAAEALNVGTTTIHRMCEQGTLEFYRPTEAPKSPRRIFIDSILAFAKKQGREITLPPEA